MPPQQRVRAGSPTAPSGLTREAPDRQTRVRETRHAPGTRKGRGASTNPANRFEALHYEDDAEFSEHQAHDREEAPRHPRTQYLRDPTRTLIATNQSPDVGFDASINPYRGCEHGCSYCYARPTHEYLGFSAGLDFETRILVKQDAPVLLRRELAARRWQPQPIGLSGVTDAYQPIERRLRITRGCLEVLAEARNPVVIVTKNALVARDADLLAELARFEAAAVNVSITSLDAELQRAMEPRASHPQQRLRAIEALAGAGVPVGVLIGPVIPGLTDHELPNILAAAASAGAAFAGHIVLRLPFGLRELFDDWLERHRPERKARVLARIRDVRGGELNDPRFGARMRGEGLYAKQIHDLFAIAARRAGLDGAAPELSSAHFRRPADPDERQLHLFAG